MYLSRRGMQIDLRTDIFSFGILLYEMLSGKRPFAGPSPTDILVQILNQDPVPLPGVSSAVWRIITKTLRKDRAERYQSIKAVQTDLKEFKLRMEFESQLKRQSADTVAFDHRKPTQPMETSPKNTETVRTWSPLASLLRWVRKDKDSLPVLPRLSQITFDEAVEQFPEWSPDGDQRILSRDRWDQKSHSRISDGSGEQITQETSMIQPAWSPGGNTFSLCVPISRNCWSLAIFGMYQGADI
jgi:serine/threonine protein kinase